MKDRNSPDTKTKEIITSDYAKSQKERKIILKERNSHHFLSLDVITRLECDCYLTTVFTNSGQTYVVAKLLKEFEDILTPHGFVRVNRNAIVNSTYVRSYSNAASRIVHLTTDEMVNVSRRGMSRLKEVLESQSPMTVK